MRWLVLGCAALRIIACFAATLHHPMPMHLCRRRSSDHLPATTAVATVPAPRLVPIPNVFSK